MRHLTFSSLTVCNSSLKSEFIRAHCSLVDPIIFDEFPRCLSARRAADVLPLLVLQYPELFVTGEFLDFPVRAVIFGLWKGVCHCVAKIGPEWTGHRNAVPHNGVGVSSFGLGSARG